MAESEQRTKVVGPILIYFLEAATPDAMFQDALSQAKKEAAKWPFAWFSGVDYPHKNQRSSITGKLTVIDPVSKTLPHLWVGLADPDANGMTWPNDAKHYEFWVRGSSDGAFKIPNVRPGIYELHAIADGVLGEYNEASITVQPGVKLDLGRLKWKPVRYGKQLWEIGVPNRSRVFQRRRLFSLGLVPRIL